MPKGLNYFGAETQSSVKQNKNTKKKNERKRNQHPSCARILGNNNNDNNVYFCTMYIYTQEFDKKLYNEDSGCLFWYLMFLQCVESN